MQIDIPELSVVALIGACGSEKSAFAKKHFRLEELISFNDLRDEICDDISDKVAINDAFDALYDSASKRLQDAKLTVIEATDIQEKTCEDVVKLAKKYHCLSVAIVFNTSEHTIKHEEMQMKDLVQSLQKKGFKCIYILNNQEEIENTEVQRTKLLSNKKDIHGPFDIIGDIHGCYDELCELLKKLGYVVEQEKYTAYPPEGRKAVFLGDLVDRGPKIPEVLRLVMSMVKAKSAYCVLGNHDGKFQRKLRGSNVQVTHGLEETLEQMKQETEQFAIEVKKFLDTLVSHYVFDEGKLVVVHAGLKEKLHGRESARVRDLAMFGQTTGETDEFGLPIRLNWTDEYSGGAMVVYGHTPQVNAQIINNTVNIDTGCVFGGRLTAFRYPEKELVDVEAKTVYCEPVRPLFKIETE